MNSGIDLKSKWLTSNERYHVIHSLEEWLTIKCDAVETVPVQVPKLPRFEFNVKVSHNGRLREIYIPGCAIAGIKEFKNMATLRSSEYVPKKIIKFAFEYEEPQHGLSTAELPQRYLSKCLYREPCDLHVARTVTTLLFDISDRLEQLYPSNEVIYYYLSVLKAINHPVVNQALLVYRHEAKDSNLYRSSLIPDGTYSPSKIRYYSLYADLIHFLGLMAPPFSTGDTNAEILEKVRSRNAKQMKILCDTIGITNYRLATRGCGWKKIVNFFEANPLFCRLVAKTMLNPPKLDRHLTIIENQVLQQLRQLWEWKDLHEFRLCYAFAEDVTTEAHMIPSIHKQCERVRKLYKKLEETVGDLDMVPFAGLLIEDAHFFRAYSVDLFPELLYAAVSKSTTVKKRNPAWEKFVATRSVNLPQKEIDEKLNILLSHVSLPETKSCSDAAELSAHLRFTEQENLILDAMEEGLKCRYDMSRDESIATNLDEITESSEEHEDTNFELIH